MKYKVGDAVRIRKDINLDYGPVGINGGMIKLAGTITTITSIQTVESGGILCDTYHIESDKKWYWIDDMFEDVSSKMLCDSLL